MLNVVYNVNILEFGLYYINYFHFMMIFKITSHAVFYVGFIMVIVVYLEMFIVVFGKFVMKF